MKGSEAIEQYLADLDDSLRVTLRRRERILSEARHHLEEAVETHQRQGASREEAERHALAAFGPPEDVAASHSTARAGALARSVGGLADCCYRVGEYLREAKNREAFVGTVAFAMLTGGSGIVAGLIRDREPLVVAAVSAVVWSMLFAVVRTWIGLRSLPRPGYVRRWLKLDRAAHERILRALHEKAPLGDSREAAFAAELRRRARGLRLPRWLVAPPAMLLTAASVLGLAHGGLAYGGLGPGYVLAPLLFSAVLMWWLITDSRRALRRAEAELLALDILHENTAQALQEGRARLEESVVPTSPGALRFSVVPMSARTPLVSVGVTRGLTGRGKIQLWQDPDHAPDRFDPADEDELYQLGEHLAAATRRCG